MATKQRKVKYVRADGKTVMVTPKQKAAYERTGKQAKARKKGQYVHVSPDGKESYTILPNGKTRPAYPRKRSKSEQVRGRIKHVRWLRAQKWWEDTPENRARQIKWIKEARK